MYVCMTFLNLTGKSQRNDFYGFKNINFMLILLPYILSERTLTDIILMFV